MKPTFASSIAALCLLCSGAGQEEKIVVIPVEKKKPVPLFFSAAAEVSVRAGMERTEGGFGLIVKIHQGRPETMSIGLSGDGEVTGAAGEGLKSWAVRREADGSRFLDLKPALPEDPEAEVPRELRVDVTTRRTDDGGEFDVLLPSPGAAVGFSATITLSGEAGALPRVLAAEGLQALEAMGDARRFSAAGVPRLRVKVEPESSVPRPVELFDAALEGRAGGGGNALSFSLTGNLVVTRPGAAVELLEGAAPSGAVSGDG